MNLLFKISTPRIIEEEVKTYLTDPIGYKNVWCFDPNADVDVTSPYYDIKDGVVSQKEWSVGYKLSHGTTVIELLNEGYDFYLEIESSRCCEDNEEFVVKVLDSEEGILEYERNLD